MTFSSKRDFAPIYCPILKLHIFSVSVGIRVVGFQITECEPGEYSSAMPSIKIHIRREPLDWKYDHKPNIDGCRRQPGLLCKLVELSLRRP
jgi:hypothetical protein